MTGVLAAALIAGLIWLKAANLQSFWYSPAAHVYSLVVAVFILSRVLMSLCYRVPADRGIAPPITVIIAVKNEEKHIAEVVARCFSVDYPPDRIEVVVVDDGSTDATWAVLQRIADMYPRLQIHCFERNLGKRHAMALGARQATGDILIYIDSDSLVDPDGFRRIVQPFADPTVGAVAGHTDIIVQGTLISKMEAVRYFVSQRIMKAAESVFGAVTCCPGPFSAYRRDAVLEVIDRWLHQTFLGAPATFGDDRSLTCRILRDWRVVYHAGARCSTYAPEDWPTLFRQQLRWKKSWVRETLAFVRQMWHEHPLAAIPYYLSVAVTVASPLIVAKLIVTAQGVHGAAAVATYVGGLAFISLLLSVLHHYFTRSCYSGYGLVFAVVYAWFFSLQTYYAVLTVRKNHWGTR